MGELSSGRVAEIPVLAPRARGLWSPLRRPLARYVRFVVRRRQLGCLTLLIPLALVLYLVVAAVGQPADGESLSELEQFTVNATAAAINEPSRGPDDYLAGMAAFDAQKMWDAYGEQTREQLAGQGNTQAVLAERLASAKADGARVEAVMRLGNFLLRDGRRYVFYIVKRSGFQAGAPPEELYYVFTVDPHGKILNIE